MKHVKRDGTRIPVCHKLFDLRKVLHTYLVLTNLNMYCNFHDAYIQFNLFFLMGKGWCMGAIPIFSTDGAQRRSSGIWGARGARSPIDFGNNARSKTFPSKDYHAGL